MKESISTDLRELIRGATPSDTADLATYVEVLCLVEFADHDDEVAAIINNSGSNLEQLLKDLSELVQQRRRENMEVLQEWCERFNKHLLPSIKSFTSKYGLPEPEALTPASIVLSKAPMQGYTLNNQLEHGVIPELKIGISLSYVNYYGNDNVYMETLLHEYIHYYGLFRINRNMHTVHNSTLRDFLEFTTVYLTLQIKKDANKNHPDETDVLPTIRIDGAYVALYDSIKFLLGSMGVELENIALNYMGLRQDPVQLLRLCEERYSKFSDQEYESLINTLYSDFRISPDQAKELIQTRPQNFVQLYDQVNQYFRKHVVMSGIFRCIYSAKFLSLLYKKYMESSSSPADLFQKIEESILTSLLGEAFPKYFSPDGHGEYFIPEDQIDPVAAKVYEGIKQYGVIG